MALTRKMLKGMSLTDEQIDTIIEAHSETVDALKEDRDKYKKEAEKLPNVQSELDTLKAATTGDDSYEKKYNDLKTEYDNYKRTQEEKESNSKKNAAYRNLLKEVGVADKRIDSIMKVTDLKGIKLDSDGKIKDADSLKKSIEEDWSDFIVVEEKKGAETATPPKGKATATTKEEIMKIKDASERQKAMAENHELFGF
jgi:hypothetical protein